SRIEQIYRIRSSSYPSCHLNSVQMSRVLSFKSLCNKAILNITKGQFICSSFDGCKVNFKFDSGKIQTVTMVGSDTHDTDILFVESEKTTKMLIQKLKASKKLIIEPSFFQEGTKQFTFDIEGFQEP
ncbi:hypothetical protein Q4209_05745, partial [Acinetobacter baumannii]